MQYFFFSLFKQVWKKMAIKKWLFTLTKSKMKQKVKEKANVKADDDKIKITSRIYVSFVFVLLRIF